MKDLNNFIGIGLSVLTMGVADAVTLSDCTKDGATITIGADAPFDNGRKIISYERN